MNITPNNDFSRRRFLAGSGAFGVGLGAVGLLRAGGGQRFLTGTDTTVPGTAGGGAFDPMRYAGQTVSILLVDGERDDLGLRDKLDEIRETMGLEVEVSTLALGALLESNNQNLRADQSAYDIAHILGFSVAGTVGAGLLAPLNDYVADPSRTPEGYDLPDFPAGQLEYCGYFDVEAGQFGGDDLFLIPGIHSGSVIMYYRPDLYEEAGLSVPSNWEDYLANAEALHQGDVSGTSMIGANDVSLFLVDWYSRFITMGGQLMNGAPATQDFEPNLTSEPSVRALQHMIDCAAVSPSGVTSYGFTESVDAFSVGNVGQMICWSTIGGSVFDPEASRVSDTVDVAVLPADEGQTPRAVRGGWGLGIPDNLPQERKDVAWHLLTYLTSQEFEQYQVLTYKTDPNRSSTFEAPDLVEALPYLPVAGEAAESAQILETALIPENFELVGEAAREFNLALAGSQTAEEACANAQDSWVAILQRVGYLA